MPHFTGTISRRRAGRGLLFLAAALVVQACASQFDTSLEEALFLLDEARYSEAEAKARQAVTADPASMEARFVLASALLGGGVLGDGQTYLGKLAALVKANVTPGQEFQVFDVVSSGPADETRVAKLEEARDTLLSIPEADRTEDVYLQLYFARIFEIAGAFSRIGGATDDEVCNANPASAFKDGIPDGLAADTLTDEQAQRFGDNLENVNGDAEKADLPEDFQINDTLLAIAESFDDAVAAAGNDFSAGATEFFNDQFGNTGNESICTVPK